MRWLFLVMVGCGVSASDIDFDLDGTFDDEDCDPANPNVFPGADEVCDGLDNNCDGSIDEGLGTRWYVDADGDRLGDIDKVVFSCTESPEGLVLEAGDCDDSDPEVSPRALERCNERDDDCDFEIDEVAYASNFDEPLGRGEFNANGDARWEAEGENGYLRITDLDAQARGAIWFDPIVHPEGRRVSFSLFTDFGPGDGMTFTVLEDLVPSMLGLHGDFLGIYGVNARGTVVEFDAQYTSAGDSTGSHVAVHDAETRAMYGTGPGVASGSWHDVVVEMEDGRIRVVVDGQERVDVEVPGGLPDEALLGFTGGNSSLTQLNRVDDFELSCMSEQPN